MNKNITRIHEKYCSIFEDWAKSKAVGDVNNIKKLKIKLLNLMDENDLLEMEKFYNDRVFLKKLENNIVKNFDSFESVDLKSYSDFCLFRNKDDIFLTCWR